MTRLKSFLTYSALLLGVVVTSNSNAQSWRFKASSDVPRDQQKILRQDIESFSKMPFVVNDETFNKVMGLKGQVKAQDLVGWLSARAKYIVGEAYEMNDKDSYVVSMGYPFQYSGIVPDIPKGYLTPQDTPSENSNDEKAEVMTVMSNIGTSLYLTGKMNGFLLGVQMPGLGKIPVTSPRVGLLQIGDGLFKIGRTKNKTLEIDSSLMRVSVLFHEARHSDGNRKSLGFTHAVCPAGHEYAGYPACDFSLNGAYSVGYQVGKAAAENCKTCTVAQREALRLDYLDSLSRVLPKQEMAPGSDDEIESLQTLKNTCETLLSYATKNEKVLKMCSGLDEKLSKAQTKVILDAQYLDATPEGK